MLALFHAFSVKCVQIQRAIRMGDDRLVGALDRQLEPLIAAILAYRADSILEMYMQLRFISNLIREEADDRSCVTRNSMALSILLDRYFRGAGEAAMDMLVALARGAPEREDDVFANGNVLNDVILDSLPDRVAVITRDYRYLYSNAANAAYLKTKPVELVGRHLSEFIGQERFEKRAKSKLDACFSGEAADYVYRVDLPDSRQKASRCRMTPLRAAKGDIIGALLVLEEVSVTTNVLVA